MSEIQIIKLVFGILLSLGTIALILVSFLIFYKYLIQEKKCTCKTTGVVRRYTVVSYGGQNTGVHLPVVFYTVNGKEYKVVGPEYKMCNSVKIRTPFSKNTATYTEKDQVLTIIQTSNSNAFISRNPLEQSYPIGTVIDVYYDPQNPKLAYVLKYCNKKWAFWLTFITGIFVFIIDLFILIIL